MQAHCRGTSVTEPGDTSPEVGEVTRVLVGGVQHLLGWPKLGGMPRLLGPTASDCSRGLRLLARA